MTEWQGIPLVFDGQRNMNPLRNPNINYFKGWFFVTIQVAKNQSVFGVLCWRVFWGASAFGIIGLGEA